MVEGIDKYVRFDNAKKISERKNPLAAAYKIAEFTSTLCDMLPTFEEEYTALKERLKTSDIPKFEQKLSAIEHFYAATQMLKELYVDSGRYTNNYN
jgi:hypothetical protein